MIKNIKVIVACIGLLGCFAVLIYSFQENLSGYRDFNNANNGETVHVVGVLQKNMPSSYSKDKKYFQFHLKDQQGTIYPVRYSKPKPINLEQAEQIVIIGEKQQNIFYAQRILMKCPSKYNATSSDIDKSQPEAYSQPNLKRSSFTP